MYMYVNVITSSCANKRNDESDEIVTIVWFQTYIDHYEMQEVSHGRSSPQTSNFQNNLET